MTYLQLVNAVMRRLREEEITTVDESDYAKLIGDFVNDAKRQCEDAWDWTALRTTFPITTIAGTSTYSLTDFGVRSKILYVHNNSKNSRVLLESLQRINELDLAVDSAQGPIAYYAFDGVDTNGDVKIRFYRTPDSAESVDVFAVKRPVDLSSDTDTLLIPSAPVVQYAYSFALRERGETGGQSASEQAAFAKQELNNAIALDAGYHAETIWTTV